MNNGSLRNPHSPNFHKFQDLEYVNDEAIDIANFEPFDKTSKPRPILEKSNFCLESIFFKIFIAC